MSRKADPHADREADRYAQPIASREFIMQLLQDAGVPRNFEEIRSSLTLDSPADREALRRRLRAMCRDGQLLLDRLGRYALVTHADLQQGTVNRLSEDRVEIIRSSDGHRVPLRGRDQYQLMDGDRVLIEVRSAGDEGEDARLVEVIEHAHRELVGQFRRDGAFGYVQPINKRQLAQDIVIAASDWGEASDGDVVRVKLTRLPERRQPPAGEVLAVLGELGTTLSMIDVLLEAHEIPVEFPAGVQQEVARLPDHVSATLAARRIDLRDLPLVTIDGADARDFDDAVHAQRRRGGGFRLWVAIADVSTYVTEDSALDRSAEARGNSVYLPDRVVPMLPEALSNDLCSLRPGVDRLALVCEMTISARGALSGFEFYEGVIRSHARLTYDAVWAMLQSGAAPDSNPEWSALLPHLQALHALYRTLAAARGERGALELSDREVRVVLSDQLEPLEVVRVQRNDAHKLIEECMITANVAAARLLSREHVPGLYRVHERPDPERIDALVHYLDGLGIFWKPAADPTPADFRELALRIADRPDRASIELMLLRTMSQAVYAPENIGHFGLALTHYAHFTSPIRRHADLLVHRAIRSLLHAGVDSRHLRPTPQPPPKKQRTRYEVDLQALQRIGDHISMTERRAEAASRQATDYFKCLYLQPRVGDAFEVTVTGVASFGLFVEIADIGLSGLLHVTALPRDYYHHDAEAQLLVGEHEGGVYAMGDRFEAILTRIEPIDAQLDFMLDPDAQPPRRSTGVHGRKRSARRTERSGRNGRQTGRGDARRSGRGGRRR